MLYTISPLRSLFSSKENVLTFGHDVVTWGVMAFPVTYIYSVIRNVKYGCIHSIGCVSEYLYFGRGGWGWIML
jgi:hypothetical protein